MIKRLLGAGESLFLFLCLAIAIDWLYFRLTRVSIGHDLLGLWKRKEREHGMASEREEGFYWVRFKDPRAVHCGDNWTVAWWGPHPFASDSGLSPGWWEIANELPGKNESYAEIGERITREPQYEPLTDLESARRNVERFAESVGVHLPRKCSDE